MKGLILKYCDKKVGNNASCGSLAAYTGNLHHEGGKVSTCYRCEEHIRTKTAHAKVDKDSLLPFNQDAERNAINDFLQSYIGKIVPNKFKWKELTGKYIKDNGGIMCQNGLGKWKFLYYHQIR